MRFEVGDLIKWTHLDGAMEVAVHLGVVIRVEHPTIKVCWESSGESTWMNANWLEKL